MSNEEESNSKENREEERERSKVRWELNDIRDELMFELDDLHDNLKEEMDDLKEEADDIKEELKGELEKLMEERESLLDEVGNIKEELEHYGADAREQIEKAKEKLESLKEKIEDHEVKFEEKVRKEVEKAQKKATRINISVDPEMSDEWRDWAEGLGASVSELVRKSMKFVKNNIGDISKLEKLGRNLEKMGEGAEKAIKNSGIEELGEKLEKKYGKKGDHKIKMTLNTQSNKEKIKKRVYGLIKLHKSLPIDKLAQALEKSEKAAENLIYEMVAEGIEGMLEENVFKFTSAEDEIISKLNEKIDKM
jgi:DNA repair exonuclease SbcCD ATPase subunit